MKKLGLLLLSITILASCTKEHPKNYLSIAGKIENNKDSIISISSRTGVLKTIQIKEDGTFKDSLKIEKADVYTFQTSPAKRAPIYLKNGFDIQLTADADNFMESFKFSGFGSDNSNFILSQIKISQKIGNPSLMLKLDEAAFQSKLKNIEKEFDSIAGIYTDLDSTLSADAKKQTASIIEYFNKSYADNLKTAPGTVSPIFTDYIDHKGGKKSLASFKGKYVYIDVWATWCGPCIQQIPFLAELEKEYHGKNIEFVSISTDESRRSGGSWEAAEKKWRDFVKEKQMGGVQLWSGQDFSFQKAYNINSIPRFILIDPKGNIVDANAPRPSEPQLKEIFNSLGL